MGSTSRLASRKCTVPTLRCSSLQILLAYTQHICLHLEIGNEGAEVDGVTARVSWVRRRALSHRHGQQECLLTVGVIFYVERRDAVEQVLSQGTRKGRVEIDILVP